MDPLKSPLDQLTQAIESALAARRAQLEERIRRVEVALIGYRRAVETELAREFAREHGFAQPAPASPPPKRAAELLLAAVNDLPEAQAARASAASSSEPEPVAVAAPVTDDGSLQDFPRLCRAVEHAKLVVIGALAGRSKASVLPALLETQTEWIDTERDGAHAVGNLPQRIRQGRVAGVIILDRAVQHRHTEAVMSAARDTETALAFAGQGGKASLLRAVEQIETTLSSRESVAPSTSGRAGR